MQYSKKKRFTALLLSVFMTIGLGSSYKNDLINDDFKIQDFYSYIEDEGYYIDSNIWRNLVFNPEKLKITDMEDALWLNICVRLISSEYAGQARYEQYLKEKFEERRFTKDKIKYCMGLSYDENITSCSIEDIENRIKYYEKILKDINRKVRKYDDRIINYVDANAKYTINWDQEELGEAKSINKSLDFELPSYGREKIWVEVKYYPSSKESYLSFEIGKFEPYKKYNFQKNDNPIRTKYQNFKITDLILDNKLNLPDEYALLPNRVVVNYKLDDKKHRMNQYPLKNFNKTKNKKGFRPNYVDNQNINQYKNPMSTNYPLGFTKRRSG